MLQKWRISRERVHRGYWISWIILYQYLCGLFISFRYQSIQLSRNDNSESYDSGFFIIIIYILCSFDVYLWPSSFHTDICCLSDNVHDYHFISQGKTTIPNVDDGEELQLTDVRTCTWWRCSRDSPAPFFIASIILFFSFMLSCSFLFPRFFFNTFLIYIH